MPSSIRPAGLLTALLWLLLLAPDASAAGEYHCGDLTVRLPSGGYTDVDVQAEDEVAGAFRLRLDGWDGDAAWLYVEPVDPVDVELYGDARALLEEFLRFSEQAAADDESWTLTIAQPVETLEGAPLATCWAGFVETDTTYDEETHWFLAIVAIDAERVFYIEGSCGPHLQEAFGRLFHELLTAGLSGQEG